MDTAKDIERRLLELPPADRARLAQKAWESLVDDPRAAPDPGIDGEGVSVALDRDREIEEGVLAPIDHNEFRRRTGGGE